MLQRRSAKKYSDSLSNGKKLGNHMPRIASGDGNEDFEAEARAEQKKAREVQTRALPKIPSPETSRFSNESKEQKERVDARRAAEEKLNGTATKEVTERTSARRATEEKLNGSTNGAIRKLDTPNWESKRMPPPPISTEIDNRKVLHASHSSAGTSYEMSYPSTNSGEYLAGTDRLKLSRHTSAPPTPLKSSNRLMYGLWADIQRHLIQAYEYLCHVGEAQQWIEGCLGEELSFGVVEMDEGLRNGVVLAKLARVWDSATVRKIFDVSCHLFVFVYELISYRILD